MAGDLDNITITKRDHELAAKENRRLALKKLERLPQSHFFEFLKLNHQELRPLLKQRAPVMYDKDAASKFPSPKEYEQEMHKQALFALRGMSTGITQSINLASLGIKTIQPQQFAIARHERESARKIQKQQAGRKIRAAFGHLKNAVSTTAMVAAAPALAVGSVLGFAANTFGAALDYLNISKKATLGTLIAANVAAGLSPANATVYHPLMEGYAPVTLNEACTPDMLKMSAANIVYARMFGQDDSPKLEQHAAKTMMLAARHDVPAIAPHLIAYFESIKFTDTRAGNSSAKTYFQAIDDWQAYHVRSSGKDTFQYQDAKNRIDAGNPTTNDIFLVDAINTVAKVPMEDLNKMVRDKNYPAAVGDALAYASTSNFVLELLVLDLKEKHPEIMNENVSSEEIMDAVTDYYAEEHFLGATNHSRLEKMARNTPNMSITDIKAVTNYFDDGMAKRLKNIVDINPALLKDGMTAPQALKSIKANFTNFVQGPYQKFDTHYDPLKTAFDLCVNPSGKQMPDTITKLEATVYNAQMLYAGVTPSIVKDFVAAQMASYRTKDPAAGLVKPVREEKQKPATKEKTIDPARFGEMKIPIPTPRPRKHSPEPAA